MKNIGFIITKSEVGGAQRWVLENAKLLQGSAKVVLITSEHGWLTEQNAFDKIEIISNLKHSFSLIAIFQLARILKAHKITTLIASSANAGVLARMSKLLTAFKCVYVSHGWSCLYNGGKLQWLFISIERFLSLLSDKIWCVSNSDYYKAVHIIKINKNKLFTLRNAVVPLTQRGTQEHENKILFVGRFAHPKRADLILKIVSKRKELSLDLIGDGPLFEKLYLEYAHYNNIRFLGEIMNFDRFNEYDVFALISDSEGLPISGIEAATAGLPLLLSDVGGCSELIEYGNGVLVNNDAASIDSGINEILSNYKHYQRKALDVADEFNINSSKEKFLTAILE